MVQGRQVDAPWKADGEASRPRPAGGEERIGNSPHRLSRNDAVETMAMPQRDDTIEAIKRLDALLEYAVMHGDEEEAERIREELRKLTDEV